MDRFKNILISIGYYILDGVKFIALIIKKIKIPKFIKKPQKWYKSAKKTKKQNKAKRFKKNKKRRKELKLKYFAFGIIFIIIFGFIPWNMYLWFRELPSPDLLQVQAGGTSTKILDRQGRLLYEIYVDRRYSPVKLEQIPQDMLNATVAVEDENFYYHSGLDYTGIFRALVANYRGEVLQGGSTITQQLIKNVLLSPERTISRKIKEAVLSIIVESKYSKDQILEMYLNNISYGGTAWGVESASQKYYGKDVWDLNLGEISMLAGLPTAPSIFSPTSGDIEAAKSRQRHVLNRMIEQGYITDEQANAAHAEELVFNNEGEFIRAPHFVAYVREELEKIYGKRMVEFGGLTVITSLDLDLQDETQKIVTEEVEKGAYLNINNASAVVLDVKDASVLAYVGSVDYFRSSWGAYDAARAFRQPGSALKPITYALALTNGYTPVSVLKDSPVTYQIVGQKPYAPVNYDGKFHGEVTLRTALANSYNIPAVRLAKALGPDNIVQLGKDMGLTTWEVDGSYGLSVVLGGKEVRLLDMANVYTTFARLGVRKNVSPFISIKDAVGYELYNAPNNDTQVLSEGVAYQIWDILSDNQARTPAFGNSQSLIISGRKVAVKTGTTDSKRDNWTAGYTPSYVATVWVGNNNNDPMHPTLSSGLSGASPIWDRIMEFLLADKPNELIPVPDSVFYKSDDKCKVRDVFLKGTRIPNSLCPELKKNEDEDKDK